MYMALKSPEFDSLRIGPRTTNFAPARTQATSSRREMCRWPRHRCGLSSASVNRLHSSVKNHLNACRSVMPNNRLRSMNHSLKLLVVGIGLIYFAFLSPLPHEVDGN